MQVNRLLLVLLVAASLTGCVGMEDYERKSDEAAGLRSELDASLNRIEALRREVADLKSRIGRMDTENQELSQSLSMARRYGQQTEARVADLRAQSSSQKAQLTQTTRNIARLRKASETARARARALNKKLVDAQKRLLRFEDRGRFQAQLAKDMAAQLQRERRSGIVDVRQTGERVRISVSSAVLFKSGSAKIRTDGKALLVKIAALLRRYPTREVQVQGHTDDVQISARLAERWETNWELSAARATRVLRYFVEVGNLDPRRASAAGMGEFRPIGDNNTRAGRRQNRRIEIVIFPPAA